VKTFDYDPGTHIRRVIAHLIANAPAETIVNDLRIQALTTSDDPEAIYEKYHRDIDAWNVMRVSAPTCPR